MQNPYSKQANTYRTQQIQSASQEQILILLYEGAIRFLNIAKLGLEEKNLERFHTNITKAQRILIEFMSTLDVEVGGDVAKNLYQLYEYLHYRLIQANLKKDVAMVEEVLDHLKALKATWEEAIGIAQKESADPMALPEEGHAYSA